MRYLVIFLLLCTQWVGPAMATQQKTIYGYIEKATLLDKNITVSAKLDTGAKSASLNAVKIKEIKVKGKRYLSFMVPTKEGEINFECEYVGDVQIKLRSLETRAHPLLKTALKRPVVMMPIKLANKTRTIRVNLANRKRFIYPLLLGREAINAFEGIVDPQLKYTQPTE